MAEPGICGKCGKSTECLNTSQGWMCRNCFHAALKVPQVGGQRLFTLPEPGAKVFVVLEPPNTFMTVGRTLYVFQRKEDADDLAGTLRRDCGVTTAFVDQIEAIKALQYVLENPSLRLLEIARRIEGKKTVGPDEVEMPL